MPTLVVKVSLFRMLSQVGSDLKTGGIVQHQQEIRGLPMNLLPRLFFFFENGVRDRDRGVDEHTYRDRLAKSCDYPKCE